ncbi:hypothetical protein LCGC14_2986670, partial [marine sediment metagenome]
VDYGSMEVRILACQSQDHVLIKYIESGGDIHGDWTMNIFGVEKGDKDFDAKRFLAKNQFIFPLFYGSYWRSIARTLEVPDNFYPNLSHYKRYGRWERHIRDCENRFWEQFSATREWQDEQIKIYEKTGYVCDGAWGFKRRGYLTRNQIYNFPIQGPAFHCLLWTISKWFKDHAHRFKTLLCGQIHDELFFDVVPSEWDEVRKIVTNLMTVAIREENGWITVPLLAEWPEYGEFPMTTIMGMSRLI